LAASLLLPPRPNLSWNDVVEYAFLADFDLLRESRQDVRDRPWSKPAFRVLIDKYFKLERAREEIQRLNIEIQRVITYIRDEDTFLRLKESELKETTPIMAHHIQRHRWEKARFNEQHFCRFRKLASLPGFTGSIQPGVSTELHGGMNSTQTQMEVDHVDADYCGLRAGEEEDEEEDDQEDADIRDTIATLMFLTIDKCNPDIVDVD
jgi:hypothetical protein